MNAKSALFVAAATVGMVAVGEVWDVKFTLKTIQNDKRTSVTIRGAYDDAANAYLFWNDKTKETLKDVEFSVTKPTYYGNNVAKNAQLAWGKDAANPDGLLVAGGFGRSTISGQAAGTYGGKPAAGTWSIKTSRKTFDKLVAKKVVDRTPDTAASAAAHDAFAKQWGAGTVVADLEKQAADSAAKVEELTQQVADLAKVGDELEATKKDLDAAKSAATDLETQLEAAKDKVAAAESAVAEAETAKKDAEQAKQELADATNQYAQLEAKYDDATNTVAELSEIVGELADVASSTGLVLKVEKAYKTDVTNYIATALLIDATKPAELDPNVTNAIDALVTKLADDTKALAEAVLDATNLTHFARMEFDQISYSNDYINAMATYDIITNKTWRDGVLAGATIVVPYGLEELYRTNNIVDLTNNTQQAWTNAFNAMNAAHDITTNRADLAKQAEDVYHDTPNNANMIALIAAQDALYIATTNEAALTEDHDLKKAELDDAKQVLADFLAGKDPEKCLKLAENLAKELADKTAEWRKIPSGELLDSIAALQKKEAELIVATNTVSAQLTAYVGPVITGFDGKKATKPYFQDAWKTIYDLLVTDVEKTLAMLNDVLKDLDSALTSEQDLATLLKTDLNTEELTKALQAMFKTELADKDLAKVVIDAAAKWGINLEAK